MSFRKILNDHQVTVERWETEIMYDYLRHYYWGKFMKGPINQSSYPWYIMGYARLRYYWHRLLLRWGRS